MNNRFLYARTFLNKRSLQYPIDVAKHRTEQPILMTWMRRPTAARKTCAMGGQQQRKKGPLPQDASLAAALFGQ
ncbi:hypothetical protein CXF92_22985 [Pseudomonas sp. Choline-3u-10]|nr:hypothetical protein CXF92_22985 [Pseudomonas sp. Choline-3u-10]